MNKSFTLKMFFLLFLASITLSSSNPKKHLPIYANLITIDYKKLQPIPSDFFNNQLKYNLFFLETKESNCKVFTKITHHKNFDYLILYRNINDILVLFQLDKNSQHIVNHQIISEITENDGTSCLKKSVLYDEYFEITTICKNYNQTQNDTIIEKYNYNFELIK